MIKFQKSLAFNALIIAVASLASRILGLFRDRVLASEFGAGQVLDSYYAAFRIPDLLFNLLILGALSSAFIPIFTEYISKKELDQAWRVASSVINFAILALVGFGSFIFLFAPQIVKLVTPGFDSERLRITIELTRIMLLSPLFFGVSSIVGGMLNSFNRFFVYSLAPIMYNIGIIAGALFFVPLFGISGLAWGVVVGAFLHLLVQLPSVFKLGFSWRPVLDLVHPGVTRVGALMLPITFGLAVSQISLLVDTIIGSTLKVGSIAVINLANNLASLPIGIIGVSFALSAFPLMAQASSLGQEDKFGDYFMYTLRQILFYILPLSVIFLVFRAQIVRLVLGAGLFGWQDTILTYRALGYFSFGLLAQATIPLAVRAFYASGDTKTPAKICLVALLVNIAGSLVFSRFLGVSGLAFALTIAAFVNIILLLLALNSKFTSLSLKSIAGPGLKMFFASITAGLFGYFALFAIERFINTLTFLGLFSQTSFAIAIFVLSYWLILFFIGLPEAKTVLKFFIKRNESATD